MTRYLSGLAVAGLGVCGGGWLVVAAMAFGGESSGRAGRVNLLTGALLIVVGCLSLICWSCAWRQRLRADGVLADRFAQVSRRHARRNRRALSRDVRRAARLAQRSARGARRAARRSARRASGTALSDGAVLGDGVALGVAAPGDERYGAAAVTVHGADGSSAGLSPASPTADSITRPAANGLGVAANGTAANGVAAHGAAANGAAANGAAANGAAANGAAAGADPGERAAELISELRSMLEPLLAVTGGQPALTDQLAALAGRPAPTPAAPLPQRTRFASELRPRVTAADLAMPGARSAPMSIPRLAQPADGGGAGPASDGEDAWW